MSLARGGPLSARPSLCGGGTLAGGSCRAAAWVLLTWSLASPDRVAGQAPCSENTVWRAPHEATWEPPLDRRVSIRTDGDPLGAVLERIATAGDVRISYSGDLIPLDRGVCAAISDAPLGDALMRVLIGVAVEPVAVGPGHVVLTPVEPAPAPHMPLPARPVQLEPVVVSGVASVPSRYGVPHGVSIVSREELERFGDLGLGHALMALVPGFWSRGTASDGALAGFAGLRGAGSLGRARLKVYLDGIEIASPGLLADLPVDAIQHVEVVRGPQGAALFGAGASDGVIHIVTRREPGGAGQTHAELRSSATVGPSHGLLGHRHTLSVRGGGPARQGSASVAAGTEDEVVRGESDFFSVLGAGTLRWEETVLTGTSRLHIARGGMALPSVAPRLPRPHTSPEAVSQSGAWEGGAATTQYTLGAALNLPGGDHWSHEAVAGVDGTRLRAADPMGTERAAGGGEDGPSTAVGADRVTLRIRSVAELPRRENLALTIAFTAEQSFVRALEGPSTGVGGGPVARTVDPAELRRWRSQPAVAGQATLSLRESLVLTGGVRLEEGGAAGPVTALPQLGVTGLTAGDGWALTIRGAYGRAIRFPADAGDFGTTDEPPIGLGTEPELHAGIEAGATLLLGDRVTFDVTRFAQTASSLTQRIGVETEPFGGLPGPAGAPAPIGRAPTPGEIANRGWEAQGRVAAGDLALVASATALDSRAIRLPNGYSGDLRAGDRIPGVPARTMALTGSWQPSPWTVSFTLRRAWNWIDYDRDRLASAGEGEATSASGPSGAALRDLWTRRDGGPVADASIGIQPLARLGVRLTGHNLFATPLAAPGLGDPELGRILGLELRVRF